MVVPVLRLSTHGILPQTKENRAVVGMDRLADCASRLQCLAVIQQPDF